MCCAYGGGSQSLRTCHCCPGGVGGGLWWRGSAVVYPTKALRSSQVVLKAAKATFVRAGVFEVPGQLF